MIFIPGDDPILVFGGPYSNARALAALRARAEQLGVSASRVFCTGDVVAYCAEPEETVAAIRQWGCHVIAGNCEQQLALGADDCGCGFAQGSTCDALSKGWYGFASQRVSAATRSWMARLPTTLCFSYGGFSLRVVHGGVEQINRFVFASQERLITAELSRTRADIVVAGHAGLPFIKQCGHQSVVQSRCDRHAGQRRHSRRLVWRHSYHRRRSAPSYPATGIRSRGRCVGTPQGGLRRCLCACAHQRTLAQR